MYIFPAAVYTKTVVKGGSMMSENKGKMKNSTEFADELNMDSKNKSNNSTSNNNSNSGTSNTNNSNSNNSSNTTNCR